ncbi:MAG TPA: PAS domain S-box protein [Spirochaetota bacterium]|nr:PAS domain S-box protein [Spirochaetota bacterium]
MENSKREHSPGYYRKLLENVNEYIYSVRYENGVAVSTYHTPACQKITGYTVDELNADGNLWFSMVHTDDRDRVNEFIGSTLGDKTEGSIEHRIIDKEKRTRWVSNKIAVVRDAAGAIRYVNGFIVDITERKTAEEELVKLYRAVEQSPATVVITDVRGTIEYVNPKFTRLTGYTYAEAIGKNPRILKSGEQGREFYRDLWDTIAAGKEWRGEFHNRKKNGELYWEFASISPIRDSEGRVTHFVAVKEDVTERKRSEEALRVSEEKLRFRNNAMEKDLKLAQIINRAVLPKNPPVTDSLLVDYRYVPLDKVGGDYFSFMNGEDGSFSVFLGDVAGHGIAAALFITLVKSVSDRIYREFGNDPERYLGMINRLLIDEMPSYFITAVYGIFRFDGGRATLTLANGGHPHPVIYRAGEGAFIQVKTSGTVIGMIDTAVYRRETIDLAPGDRVYLFTDGIPEAENMKKQMIGFDAGLVDIFRRSHRADLGETLDGVLEEVKKFTGAKPVDDDIVLIGLEVRDRRP